MTSLVAIELAFFVGLPALLMWFLNRFIGRKPAIAIGLIATALVTYAILDTSIACSAPPFFGLSGGSTDQESVYNCDGAGGGIAYLFMWGTGPIAVALLVAVTVFHWIKFQRYQ
jgi:hypothetical protein